MTPSSAEILERIRLAHGKDIDLGLRSGYANLLAQFNYPQARLSCPILVAGTNGKGSTCAFLRAIFEAAHKTVNVYTSPHLVRFHERIRLAGTLIGEDELTSLLLEIESKEKNATISVFEAGTAAALIAFARHPADISILEVGLGGRLDATNIVPHPKASVISRLSFDHRDYLGDTMASIAREKAGIMRANTPCIVAHQPSTEALQELQTQAQSLAAPLVLGGHDWDVERDGAEHFRFVSPHRVIEKLPLPALVGEHQMANAGLAMACALTLPFSISDSAFRAAMTHVEWKGRLQRLTEGALVSLCGPETALWLDGGHNDSAGEVLARQMELWTKEDPKPIDLVLGMLSTKRPAEFLTPLRPFVRAIRTVAVRGELPAHDPTFLAEHCMALGWKTARACGSLREALDELSLSYPTPSRTMICGSLYLVGQALRENDAE